ncbi:hypothetical protein QAD02_023767 [Eretmocerus hayati]|uniref:Uncharacterized protein n=1 Tax=Eretmocerus hayati TaxID=131215 RepID=A0ACC2Q073_9HYME|nr:hypothetical protein QAD02_023767 [Eretmocerus hayati]
MPSRVTRATSARTKQHEATYTNDLCAFSLSRTLPAPTADAGGVRFDDDDELAQAVAQQPAPNSLDEAADIMNAARHKSQPTSCRVPGKANSNRSRSFVSFIEVGEQELCALSRSRYFRYYPV